jgi:hypothetical protein
MRPGIRHGRRWGVAGDGATSTATRPAPGGQDSTRQIHILTIRADLPVEQAAHIARYSPARILRQCEAARAIIAEFLRLDALGDLSGRSAAENALRQLAMVHVDHPDLAQDWI